METLWKWPTPSTDEVELELTIKDDTDVLLTSQQGLALANRIGFPKPAAAALSTALTEIATNIVRYANGSKGTIRLWIQQRDGQTGILAEARDQGPGIPNVEQALTDGFSTGASRGDGLGGARRLVDHFHIDSTQDSGTTIRLLKWG
jgi:serine/threonine-protein kinase RsbT